MLAKDVAAVSGTKPEGSRSGHGSKVQMNHPKYWDQRGEKSKAGRVKCQEVRLAQESKGLLRQMLTG